MVRHAALRIVIGADLGASVAGGDHGLSLGRDAVQVFLVLHVVQTGTELFHGPVQVLELGTLFLALHHDARRDVGEPDGRIGGVHALSAGTRCAEEVLADIGRIELDVKLASLGENGHGGGRCLDAALRFGLGHTLDAVHAGLVFHDAVHAVGAAGELEHNLLVTTGGAGGLVGDFQFPAAALGEVLVHAEQVAGKDGGFVAAGAAADFHHGILAVVGVGRNEEELDLLLHFGELGLNIGHFFAGHLLEVLVLFVHEDVLGLRQLVHQAFVFQPGGDDGLQLLVILVQLHELLHIGDNLRVGQLGFQLLVLVLKAQHFIQQCVLCHSNLF